MNEMLAGISVVLVVTTIISIVFALLANAKKCHYRKSLIACQRNGKVVSIDWHLPLQSPSVAGHLSGILGLDFTESTFLSELMSDKDLRSFIAEVKKQSETRNYVRVAVTLQKKQFLVSVPFNSVGAVIE